MSRFYHPLSTLIGHRPSLLNDFFNMFPEVMRKAAYLPATCQVYQWLP